MEVLETVRQELDWSKTLLKAADEVFRTTPRLSEAETELLVTRRTIYVLWTASLERVLQSAELDYKREQHDIRYSNEGENN